MKHGSSQVSSRNKWTQSKSPTKSFTLDTFDFSQKLICSLLDVKGKKQLGNLNRARLTTILIFKNKISSIQSKDLSI